MSRKHPSADLMVELYRAGRTPTQISHELRVPKHTVEYHVHRSGAIRCRINPPAPYGTRSNCWRAGLLKAFEAGASYSDLMQRWNLSYSSIGSHLSRARRQRAAFRQRWALRLPRPKFTPSFLVPHG